MTDAKLRARALCRKWWNQGSIRAEWLPDGPEEADLIGALEAVQDEARAECPPVPMLHEERDGYVICCCGDHIKPTGGAT